MTYLNVQVVYLSHAKCCVCLKAENIMFSSSSRLRRASRSVNVNVGPQRGRLSPRGLCSTHLGASHLCVPDGMLALWLSGLGDEDGDSSPPGSPPTTPPSPATTLVLFFPQLPRCPGYLCHGNRASLPALRHRFRLPSPSSPA